MELYWLSPSLGCLSVWKATYTHTPSVGLSEKETLSTNALASFNMLLK